MAIDANPQSGTYAPGSTITFQIIAASPMPSGNFNTAHINLEITNGIVTNFINPTGSWIVLGACSSSTTFTDNAVCVSVSNTAGNITAGMELGQVSITAGAIGTTSLMRIPGTGYETPDPLSAYQVGVSIASFTIQSAGSPTPTATPTVIPTATISPTISILPRTGSIIEEFPQLLLALCAIGSGIYLHKLTAAKRAVLK